MFKLHKDCGLLQNETTLYERMLYIKQIILLLELAFYHSKLKLHSCRCKRDIL